MKPLAPLMAALALSACNSIHGGPLAAAAPPQVCPKPVAEIPAYNPALQARVAKEIRDAGHDANWPRLVQDWGYKRQQIRALCPPNKEDTP